MNGFKSYNTLASIVNAACKLRESGYLAQNNGNKHLFRTNKIMVQTFEADAEYYERICYLTLEITKECRLLTRSWIGGMIYYLSRDMQYPLAKVERFFVELNSLTQSDFPMIEILRRKLIKENMSEKKSSTQYIFALVVKTWNYFVKNNTPKILSYNSTTEEYPKFTTNNF